MEHQLVPHGAAIRTEERAPFIAETYDGGPFLDYPERSRFKLLYKLLRPSGTSEDNEAGPETVKFDDMRKQDLQIFIQTWLVFGLMHEVFGNLVDSKYFKAQCDDGAVYFTTMEFPRIVDQWVATHLVEEEVGDSRDLMEHYLNCVMKGYRLLNTVYDRQFVTTPILRSTASLLETIERVVVETLSGGIVRTLPAPFEKFLYDDRMHDQMLRIGWCPADLKVWRSYANGF